MYKKVSLPISPEVSEWLSADELPKTFKADKFALKALFVKFL